MSRYSLFGVFSVFICIKMVFFTCFLCVGFCIACLWSFVCFIDVFFCLFSESELRREISRLGTTTARLKPKGIDGGLHKRWSMWFNSKQRAEPYQSLQYTGNNCYKLSFGIQALHGCRQFVA